MYQSIQNGESIAVHHNQHQEITLVLTYELICMVVSTQLSMGLLNAARGKLKYNDNAFLCQKIKQNYTC